MNKFIEKIGPVTCSCQPVEDGWTEVGTYLLDMKNDGIIFYVKKINNVYVMQIDDPIEELCNLYDRKIDSHEINKIISKIVVRHNFINYDDRGFTFYLKEETVDIDFFFVCSMLLNIIGILHERYCNSER